MKKVNALVIGIVFLFGSMVPFTSAFADSDPGLSSQVWSNTFGWYTGFPMVDSYGYLDVNDWSITYRSNGQLASSPGPGDVVYLYQPGDYVEYSFSNYDLLSNFHSSLWGIQFGQNPTYTSGGLDDLKYILKQGYNTSDAFYKYIRGFQYDNREIDWAHIIFSYPGTGDTKIRIEYDGTPTIWNCIYIKFNGWRNSPTDSSLTTGDMLTLQNNIISAFNIARLADIMQLNIDYSDIDLTTIENTLSSLDSAVADILTNTDDIELILDNAYDELSDQYDLLYLLYTYIIQCDSVSQPQNFTYYNNLKCTIWNDDGSVSNEYTFSQNTNSYFYPYGYRFGISLHLTDASYVYYITIPVSSAQDFIISAHYYFDNSVDNNLNRTMYNCLCVCQSGYVYVILYDFVYYKNPSTLHIIFDKPIPLTSAHYIAVYTNLSLYSYQYDSGIRRNFYDRIVMYLSQFLPIIATGGDAQVPSGIQQTTDTVTEQVNDIVDFEDTYNNNLETSASQIDVSSYEIQQTSGMAFMRTYTELNFDRMQNFRILFLTPLILALAAFFLRRRT